MRALTLSLYSFFLNWRLLCLSRFSLLSFFPKNDRPRLLPHRVLSSSADPFFTDYPDPFFLKTTNLDHFFTGSFLHRPIQILSSSADPRTKLRRCRSFLHRPIHEPSFGDTNPFFTSRSTNQARRPRSFLHRPIHKPSSATQILSSPADPRTKLRWPISFLHRRPISLYWFVCVGLFVCGCVSVLIYLCGCICVHLRKTRWGAEVVVHREEREKLVRTGN